MGKSLVDYFLATKIILAQAEIPESVNEKPFSYELNKKLPSTITKDSLLPENVAQLPEVPPEVKPLANDFLEKLKRLEVLAKELKTEQEKFAKAIATKTQDKNSLQIELNKMAQELGPSVLKIDPEIQTVIATLNDYFIAASVKETTKMETTLVPEAQLEMMKAMMLKVNSEFANDVLSQFDAALQKYKVINVTVDKTIRMWPVPQSKMSIKDVRTLVAQVESDIKAMMFDLHDHIIGGLSSLLQLNTTIQDAMKQIKSKGNNIVPMDTSKTSPMGLAATRFTNVQGQSNKPMAVQSRL